MRFATSALALVASAAAASAASISFWTLDKLTRTIHFTPNAGLPNIKSVTVNNKRRTKVVFPPDWVGNFYAVQEGHDNIPGMLGEVAFSSRDHKTYFDVSGIVNADDVNNVKQIWPASGAPPMSGCEVFPCSNAYWLPDDVQTKVTSELDLIATLGTGSTGMNFVESD
ncbi:uncharacterized protein UV8b_06922 [Ustilaginoidea virens]|uniref:Uncharacterized protein n=1 Tax=Ustilaginoidea virens TaxID=1159556 RepID=A0A063C8W9_USTVR|nr:uncharacterized protein UV8b_06922 [Ustilaginoidea virens]QUC22681.1 hypothetical protein UV8b_06922 [Ustilaginoidea virens]GAO17850.1 hypothetical protein UVI_02011460 [Ustilaginoidea virens]